MTGRLPFPGDSPIERMGKRISGKHVPLTEIAPQIPAQLVRIIDQLLANKPQDRFQDAKQAAEALQALIRPKTKTSSSAVASKVATSETPPTTVTIKEEVIVKVDPVYPGWFRPLAKLAETQPISALMAVIAAAMSILAVGIILGRFFL